MGLLRTPERDVMVEVYSDDPSTLQRPVYDELAGEYCGSESTRMPAHLTAFGQKVNAALRFFGIPELEVK